MRVIEKAYAKINITLNVINKRDDGYHNLKMIMAPIELHDILTIEDSDKTEVYCDVENLNGSNNIVYNAIMKLQELYDIDKNVMVNIRKEIPIGAGLGGGSADCAATLRGLNELWNLGLSLKELAEIGVTLGADVPFCIHNRQAIVTGVGEKIEFIDGFSGLVLLVVPKFGVSTKEIFSNTSLIEIKKKDITNHLNLINGNHIEELKKILFNDLEKVSFNLKKPLEELSRKLKEIDRTFLMTGSGSVFYCLFGNEKEASSTYGILQEYGYRVLKTQIICNRLQNLL